MDRHTIDKLHQLTEEKYHSRELRGAAYKERYQWVKSLELGHRPTKEETDEVLFYGVLLLLQESGSIPLEAVNAK